ncbi:ABC transporter permease [Candidatus Riflebacteria bacterium]
MQLKIKFGGILVVFLVFLALFGPVLFTIDPYTTHLDERLLTPLSASNDGQRYYAFGTDQNGRDLFSRVVKGAQISLLVGLSSRLIALFIGVTLGLMAGYYGGIVDRLISALIDCTLAFPSLLLAIAISISLGSGLKTLIISLSIVAWADMARIMRASVLQIRDHDYVIAARSLGANDLRLFRYHIIPNCISPMIVAFSAGIATAILGEASLSFLGLGVAPPEPSWGGMIEEARDRLASHWWLSFFPGLALALAVLGFNILGDGLRDELDPSLKNLN